jgi:class 3 adenylate cyclase
MPKTSGFRTIICIDVENFSSTRRKRSDHLSIRESLYRVATEALRELNEPLDGFHIEDRGDGMLIVTPADIDNDLLAKNFLRVLDQRMRRHNESVSRRERSFRLRMAIDIGDVSFDENGVVGEAVITACRMLDSRRLKTELARSKKITLAACISRTFYERVVGRIPIEAEFRKRSFKAKNATGAIWVWTGNGSTRPAFARLGAGAALFMVAAGMIWVNVPHSTPTLPQSPLGLDPRMADPCTLADLNSLTRFGRVELDSENGEFSRCVVIVRSGDSTVDLTVQFRRPGEKPGYGSLPGGKIGPVHNESWPDRCEQTLALPDGHMVEIKATLTKGAAAEFCAMSEATTRHAMATLEKGLLPRRANKTSGSLFHENACTILSPDRLSNFPGNDAKDFKEPRSGFGYWSCTWSSTSHPATLRVVFDQSSQINTISGKPIDIGGHKAIMKPHVNKEGSCIIQIVYRSFESKADPTRAEVLSIVVEGELSPEERCELAEQVAGR